MLAPDAGRAGPGRFSLPFRCVRRAGWRRAIRRRSPAFRSARAPGRSMLPTRSTLPRQAATTIGLLRAFTGGQGNTTARGTLKRRPAAIFDLCREHQWPQEDRCRSAHDQQWQCEGLQGRPAAGQRPRARADHRGAPARRSRSDDGLAGAHAGQWQTCSHRKPASARWRSSMVGCATICNSPSSAWTRSRPTRVMPARWWSARSISRRSRALSLHARRSNTSSKQRDMEVWLAPIAGTRVLVPYPRARADADRPGGA